MQQQQIIIYRNPGEAALWEMLSHPNAFIVMVGIVAFCVAYFIAQLIGREIQKARDKKIYHRPMGSVPWARRTEQINYASLTAATLIAVAVMYWMWK